MKRRETLSRRHMKSYTCDFCDEPAIAVSTEGRPETRRARCERHRVLGGDLGMVYGRGKPENDWMRQRELLLDDDVMPMLRAMKRAK